MERVKLSVNELFSGIGNQVRGIRDTNLFDVTVACTSDIDKDVMVSYAAIHNGLTNELVENYTDYPSRERMAQDLLNRKIGYDFKNNKPYDWNKKARSKSKYLEKCWLAMKLSNNLGDISGIEELPYADLWTVSFCCQDISVAGNLKGFEENSGTRSSLVWQQIRLLRNSIAKNEAPKYIMFENVKNLVGKKFKQEFDRLVNVLDELGYTTYWEILNAKNCGIPQNRERVFAICIRKDIDTGKMTFPKPFDNGLRLKDVLDDVVDEKYYINNDKADKLIDELIENGTLSEETYPVASNSACLKCCAPNRAVYDPQNIAPTLVTATGGGNKPMSIDKKKFRIRKLTPTECMRLMSVPDEDIQKVKDIGMSDSQMYKQAGNSLVSNCVELIFEHLFKAQYQDDFKCYDENF